MDLFVNILLYLAITLGGYLVGSINNAVIISNLFFKRDVRHYGSKNAGGTNTGRVFGRKAGVSVMILDVLKTVFVYWMIVILFTFTTLRNRIDFNATLHLAMILTALGHCYPIYYKFKGGKAVSVVGGFVIASNWLFAVLGLIFFFMILIWRRMVSFASITTAAFLIVISPLLLIPALRALSFYPLASQNLIYYIPTLIGLCLLLILKHRANIERLQNGTESKVTWIK